MKRRRIAQGGTLLLFAATITWAQTASRGPRAAVAPRFAVDPMWPMPMPNHWILGSVVGVAVDARDHVFVVNLTDSFNARTESGSGTNPKTGECCTPAPNVVEYDAAGAVVGSIGSAVAGAAYEWPEINHGVAVDGQGNLWIGGMGGADSRILKLAPDGRLIAQFGKAGGNPGGAPGAGAGAARSLDTAYAGVSPGRGGAAGRAGVGGGGRGGRRTTPPLPPNSGSLDAFGGPAGFSFDDKANEAYVADGYRNHRVAVIDMTTGAVKRIWGAYGAKPSDAPAGAYDPKAQPSRQFGNPVRCARLSSDGLVYVCDTENDRIQVFRKDGSFVKEKLIAPATRGTGSVWDVTFSRDPGQKYLYVADGMNMKVHVLDRETLSELTSFGDGGRQPGQFYAVHSIATDSKGNVYTAETFEGKRVQKFNYKGVGSVTALDQGVVWPAAARMKP